MIPVLRRFETEGVAVLDFGAVGGNGSNEASVSVSGLTEIKATSKVTVQVLADAVTATHTANDHAYFSALATVITDAPVPGVSFIISAKSIHKLSGQFLVHWFFV